MNPRVTAARGPHCNFCSLQLACNTFCNCHCEVSLALLPVVPAASPLLQCFPFVLVQSGSSADQHVSIGSARRACKGAGAAYVLELLGQKP